MILKIWRCIALHKKCHSVLVTKQYRICQTELPSLLIQCPLYDYIYVQKNHEME